MEDEGGGGTREKRWHEVNRTGGKSGGWEPGEIGKNYLTLRNISQSEKAQRGGSEQNYGGN